MSVLGKSLTVLWYLIATESRCADFTIVGGREGGASQRPKKGILFL